MSVEALPYFGGGNVDRKQIGRYLALVAAGSLLVGGLAASCDRDQSPRSPIDTDGTRGGGYTPPGHQHYPKGMAPTPLPSQLPETKAPLEQAAANGDVTAFTVLQREDIAALTLIQPDNNALPAEEG